MLFKTGHLLQSSVFVCYAALKKIFFLKYIKEEEEEEEKKKNN